MRFELVTTAANSLELQKSNYTHNFLSRIGEVQASKPMSYIQEIFQPTMYSKLILITNLSCRWLTHFDSDF